MKRRSFLKVLGAGVGFIMMPEMALQASNNGIKNCADLTAAMETMFTCKMGQTSAFMEFTLDEASRFFTPAAYAVALKEFPVDSSNSKSIIRLTYQTFAYAIEGGSAAEAEEKLANHFYEHFKKLDENDKKMLAWRVKPEFTSDEVTRYGDTWMTKEEIEDRTDLSKDYIKVNGTETNHHLHQWAYNVPRGRETDPPIMTPEGVEYDFSTGALRYVNSKTMLHKMRMRLVMPEMTFEVANLIKPEGASVYKLQEKS